MKTVDLKSFLLGAACLLCILALSSSTSDENKNLDFVPNPNGIAIYNQQNKTIFLYWNNGGSYRKAPSRTYRVEEDGSGLTEIK